LFADTITPYAVNDSGLIVGQDYTTQGIYQAFVYNPATQAYTFLTPPGATNSNAVGINDSGQIVGGYGNTSGNYGYLYSGGIFTTLSVPGAFQYSPSTFFDGGGTSAEGINNAGEIAGTWTNSSGYEQGFEYSGGTFTDTGIDEPGESYTALYGINDSGLISGNAFNFVHGVRSVNSAFLYNGSTFTPIAYPGATSTTVQGINDSGDAVGWYSLDGQTSGFTYNDGTYTSIMYPGANSTNLFGISNNGEIVGEYTCTSGGCPFSDPAFYAIPTQNGYSFTTIDPPAPEPGTMLLVGGVLALGATRRRIFNMR
jgi:probable HAF family extracellular repeat protein